MYSLVYVRLDKYHFFESNKRTVTKDNSWEGYINNIYNLFLDLSIIKLDNKPTKCLILWYFDVTINQYLKPIYSHFLLAAQLCNFITTMLYFMGKLC